MKIKILTAVFISIFILSIKVFSQIPDPQTFIKSPELKTGIVGSYPTKVWEYKWIVEYWSIFQQKNISYTSFGEPSLITISGEGGGSRTYYDYNSDNLLLQTLEQVKSGEDWVNTRREVSEYGEKGNVSSYIVESWTGSGWVIEFGNQYTYTMDGEKVVEMTVKIWSREDGAWINSTRSSISFSQDMSVIETVTMAWENEGWVNSSLTRQEYVDGKISEMIMSGWIDGAWVQSTRITYEYSDFNSMIMTLFTKSGNDSWSPSQRFTENFDSHGNIIRSTVEIFIADWMMLSGSEYLLTYAGDNLTERITRSYTGASWKNVYKEEFIDFSSLSTNPLLTNPGYINQINHYPNPAKDHVTLNIDNLGNKNLEITILDLSGKRHMEKNLFVPVDNFKYTIQLDNLPAGTFIIQARDESGRIISGLKLLHHK